ISEGAAVNDIATDLDNAGIISNATVFRYWLRCEGDITITGFLGCDQEVSFQAGDYELYENMSYADAVAILEEGPLP
ncbi:MAG: endolytic transglycosylase MltG, partial [Actinobacteria bacterium]|nr:endolytic transglycosylase MltG [Actinomycetota bacterium]NIS32153.1 endolytic transglycosylase MltG [Actinomycetota bacterium]NIT96080.1 endolytic transglycosylase MltG [Actinomycetota bacterium]NIU19772.1 endolytic transglycosylase MltG [Actinomycetota bacterium]NIU67214.1 endolytic transglycosylase MltG [Actinomycetota bacterium]